MGYIRIPVSLKVEDNGDFYDFVLSLRDSKELSSFIIDLLKIYFDNKEVKDKVDAILNIYNPFTELKERLLKIQLEHSKAVMATNLLDNKIKSVVEKIEDNNGDDPSEDLFNDIKNVYSLLDGESINVINKDDSMIETSETSVSDNEDKFSKLENRVSQIEFILKDILEMLKSDKGNKEDNKQEDLESKAVVKDLSYVQYNASENINSNEEKDVLDSVEKEDSKVKEEKEESEISTNEHVLDSNVGSAKEDNPFLIVKNSEDEEGSKDEVKKVPSTFNKLMKSIKK